VKITGARIKGYLAKPDPAARATLVYGPDGGLARERIKTLAATVVDDFGDPFRVIELTGAALKADGALLRDEAQAMAFGGGRRVVVVRDATDVIAPVLKDFLDDPAGDALVLIEAGELGPRAKLRKLFESAKNGAALPCYTDDARSLNQVIDESLAAHGLKVQPDARAFLAGVLGSDRLVTRGELEKLALYMGDGGDGAPREVTLADAMACAGDTAAVSLDAVVLSAAGGDQRKLDGALEKAFAEGINAVAILRLLARHLQRVQMAQAHVARGQTPDQAMKALRPPVLFTQADAFRAQVRQWNAVTLAQAMDIVTEAEMDCKSTGMPAEAVCGRALMRVAQAARGARR
jgi:DNA polymerase-3 subunit delta